MVHRICKKAFFWSGMLLLAISQSACFFSRAKTIRFLKESGPRQYDIVIVPGVALKNGKWGSLMKGRIFWAKWLYDRGTAKNIMFSGSSVYTPYYEGKVMALYAEALGIPKEHIFYEVRAEHSRENIYYSYKLAIKLGFVTIALASDRFQTRSLEAFTRERVSTDIALFPMIVDTVRGLENAVNDPVIDFSKAFNKNFVSLKKRQSYRERIQGTKGKYIDEGFSE